VFQWTTATGGAILLVEEIPQAMRSDVECHSDLSYAFPPVYTRFESFRDEIISAADGKVENQ
jgi:hypothetical protein